MIDGQPEILMLTLSPTDNDSRVVREYEALRDAGFVVRLISVGGSGNSRIDSERVLDHGRRRLFGIPGLSLVHLFYRIVREARRAGWATPDFLHCHDTPALYPGRVLYLLARGRTAMVYDAHEFESDQRPGTAHWRIRIYQAVEKRLSRPAALMITVSDSIADAYARLFGRPRPVVIRNCPPLKPMVESSVLRNELGIPADEPIFLYQGAVHEGRGVFELMDAFRGWDVPAHFVVMGNGAHAAEVARAAATIDRVHYRPAVPAEQLQAYTGSADFGVFLGEDACLSLRWCLPNKFFEYLMAGLPVIVSNLEELAAIVRARGLGLVVDDTSKDGVRQAILEALQVEREPLVRAVMLARRDCCWENEAPKLVAAYRQLLRS